MHILNSLRRVGIEIRNLCVMKFQHQQLRWTRSVRIKKFDDTDKLERILFGSQHQAATERKDHESSAKTISINSSANDLKEERENQNSVTNLELDEETTEKSVLNVTNENQFDLLAQKVTPLYELPYDVQLQRKHSMNLQILRDFGMKLKECGLEIPAASNSIPCVLDYTIPSPVTEAYRNKDEFSIRTGADGNPKRVGFFLESTAENSDTKCVAADKLIIIKDSHKMLAKEFENYIVQSTFPACYNFNDGGHWRNIIARSNSVGDLMGIVVFHPQQLSEEKIEEEKVKLKNYFLSRQQQLNLKSFYFQACSQTRCSHATAPFQLLFGEPFISEEMNGLKYRISPESFFQVNTEAASVLYKLILNTCKAKKSTTILDVCCGVGPISLTLAPRVKRCIGIDTSLQAIEDARKNAEINGIKNVEFHAGRSENLLRDILNEIYVDELIAIINPARSSLGNTAIRALRECKYLKKVIFISCQPKTAIPNFVQLCQPSTMRHLWSPFHPIRAVPVDLFPHTVHCELVIVFQRF